MCIKMIEIIEADLNLPAHADAVIRLMDAYAIDPMGGGQKLSNYVRENLVKELLKRESTRVILAFSNYEPAGLTICFEGFSTFACKPLLNIHDLVVAPSHRRKGIAKLMLQKAEEIALDLGCCKLTLEVLAGNKTARSVYNSFGFKGYELNPAMGQALFWEKKLTYNYLK